MNDIKPRIELCRPQNLNLTTTSTDTVVIDLCTPTMTLAERCPRLTTCLSILPWYPMVDNRQNRCGEPLLVNMSPYQLTEEELLRRRTGSAKSALNIVNHNIRIPSFFREKYQLYFADLIERLKVDMALLDYNYTRLNKYIRTLSYQQMEMLHIEPDDIARIDETEYPLALEFYLQFDVNMFYMKTCIIRHARPRTMMEGLFCIREPEARYELAACGNCALCYPRYSMQYRTKKYVVEFNQAHRHTFVNGYQVILNCSASCHTQMIIYALTCPCGQVDYIGTTTSSLHDRLITHREHGNRIMHEFLLGQDNILRDLPQRCKPADVITKDRMKLYQHSVRCSVAMQIFLDANPQYWCFLPMTIQEAQISDQQQVRRPNLSDDINCHRRAKDDCLTYLEAVPKPPNGYMFSSQQLLQQTEYFHFKRDKTLPNQAIDLYQATIVAVLPEQCTDMFRWLIESMFITHADTKLNMFGHVLRQDHHDDYYVLNDPWLLRGHQWCQGLVRRHS